MTYSRSRSRPRTRARPRGRRRRAGAARRYRPAPIRPVPPGVGSPDRLRIQLPDQTTCVVAGIVERRRGSPLILGEYAAGRLLFAGQVDGPRDPASPAGWPSARRARWWGPPCSTACSRGCDLAATGAHRHGPTPGTGPRRGALRPALLAVRDDVDPRWCLRRPAVAPPASRSGRNGIRSDAPGAAAAG